MTDHAKGTVLIYFIIVFKNNSLKHLYSLKT